MLTGVNVRKLIDHTNLKPESSGADILSLCAEAARWEFKAVCVNPAFIDLVVKQLRGTDVQVCTVVGFPLGATLIEVKVFEAQEAIKKGANEIDMVINIGALKAGNHSYISNEIESI